MQIFKAYFCRLLATVYFFLRAVITCIERFEHVRSHLQKKKEKKEKKAKAEMSNAIHISASN